MDDFASDASTHGSISPGGTVVAVLETPHGEDWFTTRAARATTSCAVTTVPTPWIDGESALAAAIQVGRETVIDLGAGNSITLAGVRLADLAADDFEVA